MSTKKSKKKNRSSSKTQIQQKSKREYSFKNKLLTTLLLSFVAPLTVCFFGPFETYCGNISEFTFALGDFLPYVAAISVTVAVAVFVLLMILDGRAFDIASAVVLALTVLTFAQKYYLNLGVNALAGDGVGTTEVGPLATVLNALIWVIVIAGAVAAAIMLKKQNKARFFVSTALVLIAVLVMQSIGCIAIATDLGSQTEQGDASDSAHREKNMLTYENLNELSEGKNIVFFLIDRFDVRYFEKLQATDPEFLEGLDGFTFYNDYTSLYCRTYPAIASILTGKENDFKDSRLEFFKEVYTDGGHMKNLHNAGYDVNIYTEKYYAYDDAYYMSDYVGNMSGVNGYEIDSNTALSRDMIRLSLSTCLPFVAKDVVGQMSTPDFNAHAVYESDEDVYDADMKNVYDYITENDFVKNESKGQFSFIHIYGCHTPVKYNLNWEAANDKEKNDTTMALKQSLTIIYEYIEEMKRLGVYDDATIVITGDHPAALSDTKLIGEASKSDNGTRVTTMLFKRSGDSGTALKTSTAQISQDELWATIYESEGLKSLKTGESFFDIPEGVDRERRYLFELSVTREDKSRADEIVTYKIVGTARNRDNWSIESREVVEKIYK
ncbi:MAG: sulfatase-like hydrolase/transferase [Clostridia bacterium]|nr:sulfatase-like hydrolase/transferase [Clostridia bacterium]